MSTLSLFDLTILRAKLADPTTTCGHAAIDHMLKVAESAVASLNARFEQVESLDAALAESMGESAVEDDALDSEMAVVFRDMYEECAQEAERVLSRVDRLEREGRKVKDSNALRHWYGRTMARLSISLEAIARGLEQAKRGEVVPASELRNELLHRLHH